MMRPYPRGREIPYTIGLCKYHGDISKFLPEMENLNIHARVTGIAWTKIIEDQIPEDALRWLPLREYIDDGDWVDAVRAVTRVEEDFRERKGLRRGGPSCTTRGDKSKFEDSKQIVTTKRVKNSTHLSKRLSIRIRRLRKEG